MDSVLVSLRQPVLGICLGMQLMCRFSEENNTACMGIFDVDVKRFPATPDIKVPHMGWNNTFDYKSVLTDGVAESSYMYFVHSYAAPVCEYTIATCDYVLPFSAMLQKDNFYAAQFHCEISGDSGQKIIENFLKI